MLGFDVYGLLSLICQTCVSPPASAQESLNANTILDTQDIPNPSQTVCGDILVAVDTPISEGSQQGSRVFPAVMAYECLLSVPFHSDPAVRFVEYYNATMQFQSTIPYLKTPPEGYQQPALDFDAELERIKQSASNNLYKNQYEFEKDLQMLVYAVHDAHVDLSAGVLSAFTFGSPYYITAVSEDGKAAPKLYITDDIIYHAQGHPISAISSINDKDPITYLTAFAALNSVGMVEPHADWNSLMTNPTQKILGRLNNFAGSASFYPGDKLTFKFENDSAPLETQYLAHYNEVQKTGPLKTPGDFYNYFVLGILPDACDLNGGCPSNWPDAPPFVPNNEDATEDETVNEDDAADGPETEGDPDETEGVPEEETDNGIRSWAELTLGAYPDNPDVVQKDLSVEGAGVVTGYYFKDPSIGVLSLPSFEVYGQALAEFSESVSQFIAGARDDKLQRIVIDLQQNSGGAAFLAFDTFKQFFPKLEPFGGSRRRSNEWADALGGSLTPWWDSLGASDNEEDQHTRALYAGNEWVITDRVNRETGQYFASWDEFRGPRTYYGEQYSVMERYNLSSREFSAAAWDGWFVRTYSPEYVDPEVKLWEGTDIVILTDGVCSSACVLFVEMMTYQGGVKTVVAGGRPEPGPMQTASGSRGARYYSDELLNDDISLAGSIAPEAASPLLEERTSPIWTYTAGLNLRDQIRDDNTDIPLQFKFLAADCRIYYTLDNAFNMTRLWHDAAAAAFDTSLCVEGSVGYSTAPDSTPDYGPPAPLTPVVTQDNLQHYVYGTERPPPANLSEGDIEVGITAQQPDKSHFKPTICKSNCPSNGGVCVYNVGVYCPSKRDFIPRDLCLGSCITGDSNNKCAGGWDCIPLTEVVEQKQYARGTWAAKRYWGYCKYPSESTALQNLFKGCKQR